MATAGQTHDLVINGDGFMLAGGPKDSKTNYKKRVDGPLNIGLSPATASSYETLNGKLDAPAQNFRRAIWSKWTGLGQGIVAGADGWEKAQQLGRVNDLVALRPVQNGGALALAPQAVTALVDATAATNTRYAFCTFGALTLVSIGPRIYKTASPGTNNSGFVFLGAAAAKVVRMTVWNGTVYVATSASLFTLNIGTGALTAAATPTARAVDFMISFQSMLVVSSGSTLLWWIPASAAWSAGLVLESTINSLEEYDGSLYIGCDSGLFKIEGQLKAKAPTTAPTVLDWFDYKFSLVWRVIPSPASLGNGEEFNFVKMVAWRGYLWAFVGNRLFRIRPGSQASTLEIEEQPVYGNSRGIAVCGKWLVIASLTSLTAITRTIWVNESASDGGLGWWKLDQGGSYIYPFPNAGYNQGVINIFNNTSLASTNFYRYLVDQGNPVGFRYDNYGITRTAVAGQVVLPLVTPEDLAQLAGATNGKVMAINFRRLGMEWSVIDGGQWWPAGAGTFGSSPVIALEVSLDNGATWSTLTDPSGGIGLSSSTFNRHRLEVPVDPLIFYFNGHMYPASPANGVATGPGFQPPVDVGWTIRITFGGTEAPLLRRVWIDYDVADVSPQTGRAWEFEIRLDDPQVGLDGSLDISPNDAISKGNRLLDLAVNGTSVTFNDLDQASYRVKVKSCEVVRTGPGAMPALAAAWSAKVKIEEVWGAN